jgi:hypothetical protein
MREVLIDRDSSTDGSAKHRKQDRGLGTIALAAGASLVWALSGCRFNRAEAPSRTHVLR